MIRSRFSLLGVLLVAIGLMAVFASAAQAEGHWLVLETVGGKLVEEPTLKTERFEGSLENNTGALLSEIGTTKIDIVCTAGELLDALLNNTGGVQEGGKVKFTGCKFFSGGKDGLEKEQPKCQPKTTGAAAAGEVETKPAHALLKLHELLLKPNPETGKEEVVKEDTLLILPDNTTTQLAAELELGASCAFGELLPIFGHLAVWDCLGRAAGLKHALTHLITEFSPLTTLALFAVRGKTGAKNASVDGSANIKLHSDREWAPSGL